VAYVTGGKHFGQYTYEHWFDDEYENEFSRKERRIMKTVLKNFRIVDENTDVTGTLVIEDGVISKVLTEADPSPSIEDGAAMIIDGACLSSSDELPVLMPAFVDLHAHFRDPGFPGKETPVPSGLSPLSEVSLPSELIESASLAAAAGGFGTVVCMANTKPPVDTIEKAAAIKRRSDALGLIDLYPVLSLTKNMDGKELSEITSLSPGGLSRGGYTPLMISEDGKDPADDGLFLAAMKEAKRTGIPVSCHCDLGGDENNAVRRVIELGRKAGCRVHIAHVSTKEAVETIRQAKLAAKARAAATAQVRTAVASNGAADGADPAEPAGFTLSCEVMPHNLCLTREDAVKLGENTWGRVNPPLRTEEDRQALIRALFDGTIDAIATDHAPHTAAGKESGAPGFSGFETAFAAVYTELVRCESCHEAMKMQKLSSLMSANPAKILGFGENSGNLGFLRGRLLPGYKADLVIADTKIIWEVENELLKSRGKNSAFSGRRLCGKILLTFHSGRLVFES